MLCLIYEENLENKLNFVIGHTIVVFTFSSRKSQMNTMSQSNVFF